ncbi:apolipoprotein L6-like isoform X2 [Saccopteryx bilineata]|uniref:apolipoprotein L6-like isoform X2 n=1 Tax=Saccopteryx bilineata TaxID=59482 RepID=UPI00338ECFA9
MIIIDQFFSVLEVCFFCLFVFLLIFRERREREREKGEEQEASTPICALTKQAQGFEPATSVFQVDALSHCATTESCMTPEDTANSTTEDMSADVMLQNLLDSQAGQEWEAGAGLQRDKDDVLMDEDVEQQDGDLSIEERIFLIEFPFLKWELEKSIRELQAFADDIDKSHRAFTTTNVVTSSVSAISGVMSILGLALAPVTAGGSLGLSIAGGSLGTAAGATSIVSNIVEYFHNKNVQAQVSSQFPILDQEVKKAEEEAPNIYIGKAVANNYTTIKNIRKNVHAFKIARANPRLANAAERLLTTGRVSARSSRQVQKAFGGTTLMMTKSARLVSGTVAGLSLCADLYVFQKDLKELMEGARTETAEALRANAREMERKLTELTQLYKNLQQKEKRLRISSLKKTMVTPPQPPASHREKNPPATSQAQ